MSLGALVILAGVAMLVATALGAVGVVAGLVIGFGLLLVGCVLLGGGGVRRRL